MNKIPTLFVRDETNKALVTKEVTPGCEWVMAGEGVATRKWDGMNVRVVVKSGALVRVDKRRNPTREEKLSAEMHGHEPPEPGYVPADIGNPSDKHIFAAVHKTKFDDWPDGEWPCEVVGPKIQGNAEDAPPMLIPFGRPDFTQIAGLEPSPRSWSEIRRYLEPLDIEGLVWHHPDGRMAKIKTRDFGLKRKPVTT